MPLSEIIAKNGTDLAGMPRTTPCGAQTNDALGARGGARSLQIRGRYVSPPGDNLRVGFYVDNAFSARYATIKSNIAPWGVSFNAGRPRTCGGRIEYKF